MASPLIFALIGCLLLVVLFAASEAALAATNRVRLRHLLRMHAADENNPAQLLSSQLSGDAQRFIATVTVAANLPLLAAAMLTVWIAELYFDMQRGGLIFCVLVALGTVAFGQIAPRFLVERPGEHVRLWWVRPARLLVAILRWPVELLLFIGALLLRPLGVLGTARPVAQTESEATEQGEHEIRELVENAQASGVIEAGNRELIESIFTFGDTRAHEVMTPRPDMVALPIECSAAQLMDCLQESGYSRIPLYEGNIDRVVGIVHARDVLARLGQGELDFSPRDLMRTPLFVPETQKIDEALAAMRARHTHLSIVVDEYGGTAGLLTVEDILEELVGDIADEHDRKAEEPFVLLDEHSALVDARLHTDDLVEHWGLDLPTGEFDTVGGFVIEHLGRAPIAGDRIEVPLEEETVALAVHSVRGQRPQKILITRQSREITGAE